MKKLILISSLLISSVAFAEVPIVDLTSQTPAAATTSDQTPSQNGLMDNASSMDTSQLTTDQRLSQLEQQVQYLKELSVQTKIQALQQQIQDLRGLVEIQGRTIKQLQSQQRSLYNDLDQRISKLNTQSTVMPPVANLTPAAPSPAPTLKTTHSPNSKSTTSPQDLSAYQAAFTLVQSKQYSDAIDAFNQYLKQFPKGKYVPNAHYWLGELYVISGNNEDAKAEFFTVSNTFPKSEKAPDALYKLGLLAYNESSWKQAKQWWNILLKRYPNSNATKMAQPDLDKLQKNGL